MKLRFTPISVVAIGLILFAIGVFTFGWSEREGWHYIMSAIIGGTGVLLLLIHLLINALLRNRTASTRVIIECLVIAIAVVIFGCRIFFVK